MSFPTDRLGDRDVLEIAYRELGQIIALAAIAQMPGSKGHDRLSDCAVETWKLLGRYLGRADEYEEQSS